MAKRASSVSEIQILIQRLEYLGGRIIMAERLELTPTVKVEIFRQLGYSEKKNEKGNLVFRCAGTGQTIKDIYISEYKICAKRLEQFYQVLHSLKSEQLRHICELRYCSGYSWSDTAYMIGKSEQTCYAYRNIIKDIFAQHGCLWAIGIDAE